MLTVLWIGLIVSLGIVGGLYQRALADNNLRENPSAWASRVLDHPTTLMPEVAHETGRNLRALVTRQPTRRLETYRLVVLGLTVAGFAAFAAIAIAIFTGRTDLLALTS